jgi:hypothetical protein
MGFLGKILWKKWFKDIYLVYLPVGHTHEKVDGVLFSQIGKLKKFEKCVHSPEKFRAFIAKAFRKSPLKPDLDENMLVWEKQYSGLCLAWFQEKLA